MARGKNSVRRRASIDENGVRVRPASLDGHLEVNMLPPKPTAERYVQEVLDVIEFHWKNLSMDLKNFILGNQHELTLQKFVNYWRTRPEASSKTIAASSCGCSWYLALNYMSIGKYSEARGLLLNGSFLQQCYVSVLRSLFFHGFARPLIVVVYLSLYPRRSSPTSVNFVHRTRPLSKSPSSRNAPEAARLI
jgi:hypothetical protein